MNAMLIALLVVGLIDIAVCAVCCAIDEEREEEEDEKRDMFETRSTFWIYKIFVSLYTLDKQVIYTCKREETTESIKQIVKGICEAAGIQYSVAVVKEPFFMEDLENEQIL